MMFQRWREKRKRKQELARKFAHESAKSFSEAPWILPEDREKEYSEQYRVWYKFALGMNEGMLRFSTSKSDPENKVEVTSIGATQDSRYIPSHVRREVWRRDEGKCVRCGSRKRIEFDHIIPVSRGGSNTARNIELLCEECNRSKSNSIE